VALAGEVGYWSMAHRHLQHAADTAVLAAAANADSTLDSGVERYKREAVAAAAKYNLGGATVIPDMTYCPGTTSGAFDCYRVRINQTLPFAFAGVVGYAGVVTNGVRGAPVSAVSLAKTKVNSELYCAIALGSGGITVEGKSTGWDQCNARSNGEVKCTSNEFKMVWAPKQKTCSNYTADASLYTDPYIDDHIDAKIPDSSKVPCSSSLTATPTVVSGTSYIRVCTAAAAKLTGTTNISTNNSAIIFDGVSLNTNGFTLTVTNGSIVYTKSSGTLQSWFTDNGGSVKVTAPTSGTFANMAMVDNPARTSATAYDSKKGPDLYLSGVMYAPNRDVGFSGPIYSSLGSSTCLAFITKSLDSNGGKLPNTSPTSACDSLGYVLPGTPGVRQALVQ
jgi:hypothetical protein